MHIPAQIRHPIGLGQRPEEPFDYLNADTQREPVDQLLTDLLAGPHPAVLVVVLQVASERLQSLPLQLRLRRQTQGANEPIRPTTPAMTPRMPAGPTVTMGTMPATMMAARVLAGS